MVAAAQELVAVVDETGRVLRGERRGVVRRDNLWHAATAVLVRDPSGAIYVHRRTDTKDWAPGRHDAAAGGVLGYGEQPADGAARELAEELGIAAVTLRPLGISRYADETTRCVEHVFEVTWDGPVVHQPSEVAWGAWLTLPELAARLADPAWAFVPDTRVLLERLARDGVGDYAVLLG